MAQYMDIHRNVGDIPKEKIDEAHKKDLAVQGKHGVEITDFWHSEKDGAVFCLAEAPSKEAFGAVHREAHGLEADEIFEVRQEKKKRAIKLRGCRIIQDRVYCFRTGGDCMDASRREKEII